MTQRGSPVLPEVAHDLGVSTATAGQNNGLAKIGSATRIQVPNSMRLGPLK